MTQQNPARGLTLAEVAGLSTVLDLATAAQLLGIGRTAAYQMAGAGTLPVPVIRLGTLIRIPTAPVLRLLGLPVPGYGTHTRPDAPDPHGAPKPRHGGEHGRRRVRAGRGGQSRCSTEPVDAARRRERRWRPRPR